MKNFIKNIDKKSVVAGVVVGIFVGLFIFSALVPSGPDMIRAYNLKRYYNLRDNTVSMNKNTMNHNMGSNPYMMGEVKSEKQFVEDMIPHHQAAVAMAEQVLKLSPSAKVKKLAEDVIKAQTSEISMMQEWLKNWK